MKWEEKGFQYFKNRLVSSSVILSMLAAAILSSSFEDDSNQVSEKKLLVKLILDSVTLGLLGVNFKVFEMPQFHHLGY